ncbi:OmpA family protein [Campylobacter geochelonis]|uniref:OmpA family protein n=1 Tax=Campylobacter geochelonis TaxID=1780362 RepID=UPI00077074D9|nr:OmpA family protein [Campylobacter geochelonis]CZE50099.1 putative chemotaxis protein MotB [Campylobacter geochelonis]
MKINKEEKDTFWIAYADLMAGLLFVFILLIGGIIVKYFLTQSTLKKKEADFITAIASLQSQEKKNSELEALNKIFSDKLNELDLETKDLKKAQSIFIVQIDELEKMVSSLNDENSDLNKTLTRLYNEKLEQEQIINNLNISEEEKRQKIAELNKQKDTQEQVIAGLYAIKSTQEEQIYKLNKEKLAQDEKDREKEAKIVYLLEQMSKKEQEVNQILYDLNVTKNRIKNLTGIKVKVIADIKEKLGDSVSIDANSGALRLSSSILFDKASSKLKDDAKEELKRTLQKYFSVLMQNDEIRKNLDQIVIEGHTDSDGGYIYNLELSQQRAFAVMDFINSWNSDERLKNYLIASGRSFMSPVIKDGIEDKDASRRIEIKFLLSNKAAIDEIQKFLNYDRNQSKNR